MKCPKCSHVNDENARYCSQCGNQLLEEKQDWNSILLLAYCFSLICFSLIYLALRYIFEWTEATWQTRNYVYLLMAIIGSLLTFVIPFGIRKTWMKITAFAVVGIAALINIIQNIVALVETYNANY